MKNLITIILAAVTIGIFSASASAQSTSDVLKETYCFRFYVEVYDDTDHMFLDAYWMEDAEGVGQAHLAALKNFYTANVTQSSYKTHQHRDKTITITSDIHIATKLYHADGSITYRR